MNTATIDTTPHPHPAPCGRAEGTCGKAVQTCGREGCGVEVVGSMPDQRLAMLDRQNERDKLAHMTAQRDALIDAMREEIEENLRLRELGGAECDENITAMTERIIKERDKLAAELAELRAQSAPAIGSDADEIRLRYLYTPLSKMRGIAIAVTTQRDRLAAELAQERAQRVTLQRHAADQAEALRVMTEERDKLRAACGTIRFAGWFSEEPSGMSYRLWEQGGHDRAGDEVALYQADDAVLAANGIEGEA